MTGTASDDRHHRRSWLTNAGWLTAASALSIAVSAAVGLALVRVFGAADLGRYSLGTVAAVMGTAVVGFRLDQQLLTRLRLQEGDDRVFAVAVRAAYTLYFPAALIAAAVVTVGFSGSARLIGWLSIIEVGLAPMLFNRVVLQVAMRQRDGLVCTAASRLCWLLAVSALIAGHSASVQAVMSARIIATLVEIGCLVRATGYGPGVVLRNRTTLSAHLDELRATAPLATAGLAGEFNGRIDQPMLAVLHGPTELGIYAAAVRIADLAGVLGPIAQTVVAPGLVDAARRGDSRAFESVLRDGLIVTLIPSALLVSMTMGQSGSIVRLLAGHQFESAASLVVLIAAAEWATFVCAAYSVALLALGQRRVLALASSVGLAVNFIGNVMFMPVFGARAAAWMTLVGFSASMLVTMFGSRDVRHALPATVPVVLESAASVGVSAAVIWLMRSNFVASITVGSLVYLGLTAILLRNDFFRALRALRRPAAVAS